MSVMRTTITAKKEFMEEFTLTCNFGGMGVHDGRQAWYEWKKWKTEDEAEIWHLEPQEQNKMNKLEVVKAF